MQTRKLRTDSYCSKCGEEMVCPKCQTVIERTNSIIIRYKNTIYNGGYPNALVITPLYTDANNKNISCATIAGDNFSQTGNKTMGYTYMERGDVEQVAKTLARSSMNTWCKLFGFPKNRVKFAKDIQEQLIKYVEGNI